MTAPDPTPEAAPLNDAQRRLLGTMVARAKRALDTGPAKQAAAERAGAQIRDIFAELEVPTGSSQDVIAILSGANIIVENIIQAMQHDPSIPFYLRVSVTQQLDSLVAALLNGMGAQFTTAPVSPADLPAWIAEQSRLQEAQREMEARGE